MKPESWPEVRKRLERYSDLYREFPDAPCDVRASLSRIDALEGARSGMLAFCTGEVEGHVRCPRLIRNYFTDGAAILCRCECHVIRSENMTKYRKRPVVIEAMRFTSPAQIAELKSWSGGAVAPHYGDPAPERATMLMIITLKDETAVNIGSWIIKDANGDFYSCKPDIFDATYEPVWSEGGVPIDR